MAPALALSFRAAAGKFKTEMIRQTKFVCIAVAPALAVLALAGYSHAQALNSGASTIALQAVLNDSITVSLSSSAVNFNLTPGSANNPGSASVTATTSWLLKPSAGSLSLYAFFSSSVAALADGAGDNIPPADFQISDNAGPLTALTNTVPFGGANAGLQLWSFKITGNKRTGSTSDQLNFNLNLSTLPNLPAGTYTGTLTIQAQAL